MDQELRKEIEKLTGIDLEWFDERAAICQYDGGLTRDEAEMLAYSNLINRG